MKILVDAGVPFAGEAFAQFGTVDMLKGSQINGSTVRDADIVIIRSTTKVREPMLNGSNVRFIGSATTGVDHVDTAYLHSLGVEFAAAYGSNARSVAEYVAAALLQLRRMGTVGEGAVFGVLGVGEIGRLVAQFATALGMRTVLYDPPRELADTEFRSATLDELLSCDVVSLHVPLTSEGSHPTHRLVDRRFMDGLRKGATIINTSRGDVIDNAWLERCLGDRLAPAVLDVWPAEPDIPASLAARCAIATPHIAGHAIDAKLRATSMMVDAVARFVGEQSLWRADMLPKREEDITIPGDATNFEAACIAVERAYPLMRDDGAMRAILTLNDVDRRSAFDRLRRDYPVRREFGAYGVPSDAPFSGMLRELGFSFASM